MFSFKKNNKNKKILKNYKDNILKDFKDYTEIYNSDFVFYGYKKNKKGIELIYISNNNIEFFILNNDKILNIFKGSSGIKIISTAGSSVYIPVFSIKIDLLYVSVVKLLSESIDRTVEEKEIIKQAMKIKSI